jgi:hypothetical protein
MLPNGRLGGPTGGQLCGPARRRYRRLGECAPYERAGRASGVGGLALGL